MPAFTNSRFGSSKGRGTLGTTVCPLRSKCPRKRARMSADLTRQLCQTRGWALLGRRAVQSGALAQFGLPLGHGFADIGPELRYRGGELAQRPAQAVGHAG